MTPVVRLIARNPRKSIRRTRPSAGEQQFQFPAPDAVAELACDPDRGPRRRDIAPAPSRRRTG